MEKNHYFLSHLLITFMTILLVTPLTAVEKSFSQTLQQQMKSFAQRITHFKDIYKKCRRPEGCSLEEKRELERDMRTIGVAGGAIILALTSTIFVVKALRGSKEKAPETLPYTEEKLPEQVPVYVPQAELAQEEQQQTLMQQAQEQQAKEIALRQETVRQQIEEQQSVEAARLKQETEIKQRQQEEKERQKQEMERKEAFKQQKSAEQERLATAEKWMQERQEKLEAKAKKLIKSLEGQIITAPYYGQSKERRQKVVDAATNKLQNARAKLNEKNYQEAIEFANTGLEELKVLSKKK